MPLSYTTGTTTGASSVLTVGFEFIKREHVSVWLNEVLVPTADYVWLDDGQVQLDTLPAAGLPWRTQRDTPLDDKAVTWTSGSISSADLNLSDDQILYAVQEARRELEFAEARLDASIVEAVEGATSQIAQMIAQVEQIVEDVTQLATPADGTISAAKISTVTGSWWVDQGAGNPVIFRFPERVLVDDGTDYRGAWVPTSAVVDGLTPEAFILHNWAPRDASLYADSRYGAMTIVGHSQASKRTGWPGMPSFQPATIGVSGFGINDVTSAPTSPAWGGYFDVVQFSGAGFTAGVEISAVHLGAQVSPAVTPFNVKTGGANDGVVLWLQSGGGLDAVGYANQYGAPGYVSAGIVFLSSLVDNSAKMGKGIVFADGVLVDQSGGSNVYVAMEMPQRHWLIWSRLNGGSTESAAFITCNTIPAGSAAVGLTFALNSVEVTGSAGVLAAAFKAGSTSNNASFSRGTGTDAALGISNTGAGAVNISSGGSVIFAAAGTTGVMTISANFVDITQSGAIRSPSFRAGGFTNSATISRTDGANASLTVNNPGSGEIVFQNAAVTTANINAFVLNLKAGASFSVNNNPVVGARRTGWAVATGTDTRSTFDTASVTLPQLAERVKALIDDLHSTAGHGLIGT